MNYTFIILGVILVIVLYVLYKSLLAPTSVISSQTYLGSKPEPIRLDTITKAPSINCSYALWIYVNSLDGSPNNIFKIKTSSTEYVSLDIDSNTTASVGISVTGKTAIQSNTITPNFPLQRWEYVVISINQQILDLYLDGKLIKSINLGANTVVPSKDALIAFGNGDIYVAGFKILSDPMDPQTAWNNYLNGSGTTTRSLTNYGLSMTFSKNNNPEKTITLF